MSDTKTKATQVGRETADRIRESMASNDLATKAKDAAYTLVGLGVMGAQKATAATKSAASKIGVDDATKSLDVDAIKARTEDAKTAARRQLTKADDVLGDALARVEEAFAPLEERLPDPAKDTVVRFREASKGLHAHVRTRLSIDQPEQAAQSAAKAESATATAKKKAPTPEA